jgi:hypothetical protein
MPAALLGKHDEATEGQTRFPVFFCSTGYYPLFPTLPSTLLMIQVLKKKADQTHAEAQSKSSVPERDENWKVHLDGIILDK